MAFALAVVVLLSLAVDYVCRRVRVPGLVGMLFVGVLAGPFGVSVVNAEVLGISPELRRIALLVILLRAGLELSRDTLSRVGARALVLSCVPAVFEGAAITLLGPPLLGLSYLDSALLGAVVAAVSPAVLSIVLTAPTGAWAIAALGQKVLQVEPDAAAAQMHSPKHNPLPP